MIITHEHIEIEIERWFKLKLKVKQVNVMIILLIDWKDIILIAKTEFDKSLLFQAAPLMFDSVRVVMIIMLLKALEKKQCEKLQRMTDSRLFILNSDSNETFNQ